MTYDEKTVVHRDETVDTGLEHGTQVTSRTVERRPSGGALASRVVIFIFGIIQAVIVLRIILLLLNAREGNDIVSFILNMSQIFVGPFEGMLRTNALASGGSILDVSAIVALVGWTILEALILAGLGIFRREPA